MRLTMEPLKERAALIGAARFIALPNLSIRYEAAFSAAISSAVLHSFGVPVSVTP